MSSGGFREFTFEGYRAVVSGKHCVITDDLDYDQMPQPHFYQMQAIKNRAFGEDAVAVEVFPAENHLSDGPLQRRLWEVPSVNVPNLRTGHRVTEEDRKV